METLPFDPADYLDSEEGIAAYLADAREEGSEAFSDAVAVVARARANRPQRPAVEVAIEPNERQG